MSKSGSFSTNTIEGRNLKFSWSISSQSSDKNTTTINWKLTTGGSASGWVAGRKFKVIVNNSTVYSFSGDKQLYPNTEIASGKKTITHNSDGEKSFSAKVEAAIYTQTVNAKGSGSWNLERIPRGAEITSIVSPNVDILTDEMNFTISYEVPAYKNTTSAKIELGVLNGFSSDGIPFVDPIIPNTKLDISKSKNTYEFKFTQAQREKIWEGTKNRVDFNYYIEIVSYVDGKQFYSAIWPQVKIINAKPDIPYFHTEDVNPATLALTRNKSEVVSGYSDVHCDFAVSLQKKALAVEEYVRARTDSGSKKYNGNNITIHKATTGDFTAVVRDSRGYSYEQLGLLSVIEYFKPTCAIDVSAELADNNTVTATLNIEGKYFDDKFTTRDNNGTETSPNAKHNTRQVSYRYKSTGDWSTWTPIDSTVSNNKYSATVNIPNLPYQDSYVFEASIKDELETVKATSKAIKLLPVFDWGEDSFNFNVPVTMVEPLAITSGGTGAKDPTENKTISYNTAHFTGHSTKCEKVSFLGMTFIKMYVKTNGNFSAGKSYPIGKVPSDIIPSSRHALSVRSTRNITASIDETGEIEMLVGSNFSGAYDVYITGFWFNS